MVAIDILGTITQFNSIPSTWNGILNYNSINNTSMQIADGWKDVIIPVYDTATQKLGDLILDEPNYTYQVLQKTNIELQNDALSANELNKQITQQSNMEAQSVLTAQTLDDTKSLNSQELFPLWGDNIPVVIANKWQDFDDDNILYLWRCEQTHTTQSDWRPKDTPALWTKVAYPGTIPVWVQPTGAQDAYNIGDQVHYPLETDPVYESLIDATVWSPDVNPGGWQLI